MQPTQKQTANTTSQTQQRATRRLQQPSPPPLIQHRQRIPITPRHDLPAPPPISTTPRPHPPQALQTPFINHRRARLPRDIGIHTRLLHVPHRDGEVVDVVPHHVDEVDAVAHVGDVLLVQEGLVARGEDVGRGAVLPAEGLGDFEHVAAVHVGVFAGGGGGAVEGREDGWGEGGGDGFGPWGWGVRMGWEG